MAGAVCAGVQARRVPQVSGAGRARRDGHVVLRGAVGNEGRPLPHHRDGEPGLRVPDLPHVVPVGAGDVAADGPGGDGAQAPLRGDRPPLRLHSLRPDGPGRGHVRRHRAARGGVLPVLCGWGAAQGGRARRGAAAAGAGAALAGVGGGHAARALRPHDVGLPAPHVHRQRHAPCHPPHGRVHRRHRIRAAGCARGVLAERPLPRPGPLPQPRRLAGGADAGASGREPARAGGEAVARPVRGPLHDILPPVHLHRPGGPLSGQQHAAVRDHGRLDLRPVHPAGERPADVDLEAAAREDVVVQAVTCGARYWGPVLSHSSSATKYLQIGR
mmetsp:Transcript_27440/g.59942  ORF Transcript_27440/g.59942 Transcript_27440/m.59942 type:complete len:329 (-) Transcript_27440:108-1094(-)